MAQGKRAKRERWVRQKASIRRGIRAYSKPEAGCPVPPDIIRRNGAPGSAGVICVGGVVRRAARSGAATLVYTRSGGGGRLGTAERTRVSEFLDGGHRSRLLAHVRYFRWSQRVDATLYPERER